MYEHFKIEDINDIIEIEKIPVAERITQSSTYEIISRGAAIDPNATAISFIMDGNAYDAPIEITHGQLLGRINQSANLLHELGVGPTDVVTYLLPNIPQTHFVLWGAETVGIANPVNPMLEADTIKDICNAAGTKVLVALAEMPGVDIWSKAEAIKDHIPSLNAVVRIMGPSDEGRGIYGYEQVIDSYPADRLTFERDIKPDDIASLYHTGGTTGRPKLARRTHYNEVVLAWDIAIASELQTGEAVICGLPLFHCNGTCVTGLMPFSIGGQVVLLPPSGYRDQAAMANFWKIVEHYRPTFFSAVPTVLSVLLGVPVGGCDVSSLRYALCGAAPLSVELFQRFETYSGLKIIEGFGMTETACASSTNPKDGLAKIGSVGVRLPYHWFKIAILGPDGNYARDAETNEIGVVCTSGPCVFKGYVEDEHNEGIWLDAPGGWFNTGDLGRIDEDGFLWLTGRRKELIIRGGHNIDPATIEEALYKLEGVNVAAAVGRPDPHAGEVPVAYVELAEGIQINEDDLVDWAKNNLGEKAAVPKAVHVVDTIPLTAVGKIFKPALQWDAIKRVYSDELRIIEPMVRHMEITVGEDKVHGTGVQIMIEPTPGIAKEEIAAQAKNVLANYSVHYDLKFNEA